MDLVVMTIKGYTAIPKGPALMEPHYQIVLFHIQNTYWRKGFYLSAEMQSVYFTALADWAAKRLFNTYKQKFRKWQIKPNDVNEKVL